MILTHRLGDMPEAMGSLLAAASTESFMLSLPWFRVLSGHGSGMGAPVLYSASDGAARAGLVVNETGESSGWSGDRRLTSLANFYTSHYAPLLCGEDAARLLPALIDTIVATRPAFATVSLTSLDPAAPAFGFIIAGFRRRGWIPVHYFHFGNWYENTDGIDGPDYFSRRPGQLRNTLKRQAKKLAAVASPTYRLFTSTAEIAEGIACYETVYAASWKEPEPFPRFAAELIAAAAAAGSLRLGVMLLGTRPVAVQIWLVWQGKATIFKLAHDRGFDGLSVGSLLTRWMMETVLAGGGIREVDFGRGDDPYKRLWLRDRRERWGIVAFNPRTVLGLIGAVRHFAAAGVKKALRRPQPT